jgi:thioesterase domain-containing protein
MSDAPAEFLYLRPLRTSGGRPPLICFFPGYPGARDLAAALPDDQPVYEVWWPNMDNEVQYPTIGQLADLFIPEIQKLQPHGPYQFCGYSTFGLVAYEMGRRLLAEGQDVGFLALFDIWHPQFLDTLSSREMARYKVLRVVDRLGKYRRILKGGGLGTVASQLAEFAVNKSRSIAWRFARVGYRLAGQPVPKGMQIIASIAANKSYVPLPYPKRFVLIRTEDLLDRKLRDRAVGWHKCAPAGIDLYFIEGDHSTIKDEPFVRGLVAKIAPHLAGAFNRRIDSAR